MKISNMGKCCDAVTKLKQCMAVFVAIGQGNIEDLLSVNMFLFLNKIVPECWLKDHYSGFLTLEVLYLILSELLKISDAFLSISKRWRSLSKGKRLVAKNAEGKKDSKITVFLVLSCIILHKNGSRSFLGIYFY